MNSMLGAFVGDAAGAILEFCRIEITEEMALEAMKMPGGGIMDVGPGQITDDGELTLTLWNSLNVCNGTIFPAAAVARGYAEWYRSNPFDMGTTCRFAFSYFCNERNTLQECLEYIKGENAASEANGALMRATAIPTWFYKNGHTSNVDVVVQCAKEDALMSHPNIVCQECNAIYVFAIWHLLKGVSLEDTQRLTDSFVTNNITSEKVKEWYFIEAQDVRNLKCTRQIGHVRWGFVLAMYFLKHPEYTFEEAIKLTLMAGGDTDTNAAIVGGLVGSYRIIPSYMLRPVTDFDCTTHENTRPAKYSVKKVLF
jgi:ADP-ribosyl-[dinitrogen reductase] hydrolase